MKKLACLLVFLGCTTWVLAQNEGNIWYFGDNAGLDFSSGSPVQLFDGALETFEGCASFCDADGNLLFYTNGGGRPASSGQSTGIIWNADHDVMYDMQGIEGGGFSAAQSAVIFPKPGSATNYCLFTMEEVEFTIGGNPPSQPLGRGLRYFEIDMSLNSGLGDVVVADQPIHQPAYECLTAIQHSNGIDYWVLTIDGISQQIVVVPVTTAGIQTPLFFDTNPFSLGNDGIQAAPDGSFFYTGGFLYEFNNATGTVSNSQLLDLSGSYTASFSPNSQYLYTTLGSNSFAEIIRFDLNATDIFNSKDTIDTIENELIGQMQLGPDGNIYVLTKPFGSANQALNVIQCPNSEVPTYEEGIFFFISPDYEFFGLPNFPDHIFADDSTIPIDLGPGPVEICIGDTLVLDAGITGVSYEWSTGETTQTISVTNAGFYYITVTEGCETGTDFIKVETVPTNTDLSITGPAILCPGETATLEAGPMLYDSIVWSDGTEGYSLPISGPGLYSVTAINDCGDPVTASINIGQPPISTATINGDTSLCDGSFVVLTALVENAEFVVWDDGTTNILYIASEPGIYTVYAVDACMDTTAASIEVALVPLPTVSISGDSILCTDGENLLTAIATEAPILEWSDGSSTQTLTVDVPGIYSVTVTNQCMVSATAEIEIIPVPTPLIELSGPDALCEGADGSILADILWSDGSFDSLEIPINAPGSYAVTVTNVCQEEFIDSLQIAEAPLPSVVIEGELLFCVGDTFSLVAVAQHADSLLWSDGTTGTSLQADKPGLYSVQAINDCGIAVAELEVEAEYCGECLVIPNVFSPNGDGTNDTFAPLLACPVLAWQFDIYDRWGELIFSTSDPNEKWNGISDGTPYPSDVYAYVLRYQLDGEETAVSYGEVTLLR